MKAKKLLKKIQSALNNYGKVINGVSRMLIFLSPTKSNWISIGRPSDDCPIYAYRERNDGTFNQLPIDEMTPQGKEEISEKVDEEFGDVK